MLKAHKQDRFGFLGFLGSWPAFLVGDKAIFTGSSQLKASLGQRRQLGSLGISQWLLQEGQATQKEKGQWQVGTPCTLWVWPMAHYAVEGRERGKPPNTVLFLPCCELPSATTQLNKTHTWFIFGLATPLPPQIWFMVLLFCALT